MTSSLKVFKGAFKGSPMHFFPAPAACDMTDIRDYNDRVRRPSPRRLPLRCCLVVLAATLVAEHAVAEPPALERLEAWGGQVKLAEGKIVELTFRNSKQLLDEQWQAIGQLEDLRRLTAYGGAKGLNDQTIPHLLQLQQLESIGLDGAQLSDRGLARMGELKQLRQASFFHLSFRMPGFTGKGFEAWAPLPRLESLTVAGMSMGDEGFRAISKLQQLRKLRTWHTYRTEASNAMIAAMPKLASLRLGQRLPRGGAPKSLSNQSIPTLLKLRTLESLELSEADFSVEALSQLQALPKLQRLKLDRTYLTAEDVAQLRKTLTDVKIDFEPLREDQRQKLEAYLR